MIRPEWGLFSPFDPHLPRQSLIYSQSFNRFIILNADQGSLPIQFRPRHPSEQANPIQSHLTKAEGANRPDFELIQPMKGNTHTCTYKLNKEHQVFPIHSFPTAIVASSICLLLATVTASASKPWSWGHPGGGYKSEKPASAASQFRF